ncbi:MAG: DUF2085 domain-containing protein [Deltaproteobacteria bacterium]|nr:MAG: DUF2085 domain-containing protein [Deltaproteobacteria bacterium]
MAVALRAAGALISGAFVFLAWFAPVYQSWKGYPAGEGIYQLLNPFCHQYPTRSLWVWDRPFALCSRCFAGYLGVFFACLFLWRDWSYTKRLLWGVLLLAPGVIDPIVQFLTPYESTNTLRVLTGLAGGVGVFLLLYPYSMKREVGR